MFMPAVWLALPTMLMSHLYACPLDIHHMLAVHVQRPMASLAKYYDAFSLYSITIRFSIMLQYALVNKLLNLRKLLQF